MSLYCEHKLFVAKSPDDAYSEYQELHELWVSRVLISEILSRMCILIIADVCCMAGYQSAVDDFARMCFA